MATRTHTVIMSGDFAGNYEGASLNLKIYGTTSLGRVRAKKSASGYFAFNIDTAASQVDKFIPAESVVVDFNAATVLQNSSGSAVSDGDTIDFWNNDAADNEATAPSGDEPEWMSSGDNITNSPTVDFLTNGGDERFVLGTAPSFASGEEFSIAIVVDNGNTNTNRPFVGSDVGAGSNASRYGNGSNRNIMIQDESGNSIESTAGSSTNFKNKDIHVAVRLANDRVLAYRRGVEILDGTSSLSGTFSPSIIGNARESSSWGGQKANITRVIVADEAWSDASRENVEAWLAWEYDLQTTGNSYLPSSHVGYRSDPRTSKAPAFSSDIDLSALAVDTWSSYFAPTGAPGTPWDVDGPIAIYPTKDYKAGTITIELEFEV